MSSPSPTPPPPAPESSPDRQTDFDIGEEYGTARKSLPPAGIVAICIAVVVTIAAVYALTHRAHPLSSGSIDDIVSVPVPRQDMVMVAVDGSPQNKTQKPSWIHTIHASLATGSDKLTDDPPPAGDVHRDFAALP